MVDRGAVNCELGRGYGKYWKQQCFSQKVFEVWLRFKDQGIAVFKDIFVVWISPHQKRIAILKDGDTPLFHALGETLNNC